MGIINKDNYEIYFLDYLEGNLPDGLKRELDAFLLKNPELKEELDGLEDAVLPAEDVLFPGKEILKKEHIQARPSRFVSDDEYIIASIENDLNEDESIQFKNYLKSHPHLMDDFILLSSAKLQPDENIVFENKDLLKRSEYSSEIISTHRPSRFLSDDDFLVAKLEGDLSAEEEEEFEIFININKHLKSDYALLQLSTLSPDTSIKFDDKNSLKRFNIQTPNYSLRKFMYAAASVAAVFIFGVLYFYENDEPLLPDGTANYIGTINSFSKVNYNERPENKLSFTGTPVQEQRNEQVVHLEIRIQKKIETEKTSTQEVTQVQQNNDKSQDIKNSDSEKLVISNETQPFNSNGNTNNQNKITPSADKTNSNAPVKQDTDKNQIKKNSESENNLSFWKIASLGIKGLSNITGKKMELNKHYNSNGDVKSLAFNSQKLSISAPVKKK